MCQQIIIEEISDFF